MTNVIRKPKICIPIIATTYDALIDEAEKVLSMRPDLIEWRADYFLAENNEASMFETLISLTNHVTIPIVFTLRGVNEGGRSKLSDCQRLALIQKVLSTGLIQLVDVELDCSTSQDCDFENRESAYRFQEIMDMAHTNNIEVILSNHNFSSTPDFGEMIANIKRAQKWNADYCKLAYLANSSDDMMSLLSACQYGSGVLNQKMIVVSMGEIGKMSRIIGGEFGSEMTYAKGINESAPGQMSVVELIDAWESALVD